MVADIWLWYGCFGFAFYIEIVAVCCAFALYPAAYVVSATSLALLDLWALKWLRF